MNHSTQCRTRIAEAIASPANGQTRLNRLVEKENRNRAEHLRQQVEDDPAQAQGGMSSGSNQAPETVSPPVDLLPFIPAEGSQYLSRTWSPHRPTHLQQGIPRYLHQMTMNTQQVPRYLTQIMEWQLAIWIWTWSYDRTDGIYEQQWPCSDAKSDFQRRSDTTT